MCLRVAVINGFGRNDNFEVVLQTIHGGGAHAPAGGQAGDHQRIYARFSQVFIETGLEKPGSPLFFENRLAFRRFEAGIDLLKMPKSDFDDPFGTATGSGVIFGASGGVMEAAIRTVVELVTGHKVEDLFEHAEVIPVRGFEGVRYAELPISEVGPVPDLLAHLFDDWNWLKGVTLKVGVCHGTANAKKVMEDIKAGGKFSQCHFIEFMACPGGCLGGGGQPSPTSPAIRAARAKAIYAEDRAYDIRKSHENPALAKLYGEFLTDGPGGRKSHHLLHTKYVARGKYIE